MYHLQGLLQPEIADRLNLNQSRVSRLLKEAQRLGIVRTVVVTPPGLHGELEDRVRDHLGLLDVLVADAVSDDDAGVLASIGPAAAAYLEHTLRPAEHVGISSRSAALLAMVEALGSFPAVEAAYVVQTLGAVGNPGLRAQATRLTARLADFTGATPIYLSTPGVVASRAVRDGLLSDPHIAAAAAAWRDLTVLLTGVGAVTRQVGHLDWGAALPPDDLQALADAGAVGDVCLNFFDADGGSVGESLRERVLGIGADELRQVHRRIAVAGGRDKVAAIRAAARGGWINVLITDQHTARRLLG